MVTDHLQELGSVSQVSEIDNRPYIPEGFYIVSDGSYFTHTEGLLIINNASLVNCKNHPDTSRLNGCCGLDGTDGPNKVCINGHEIGTERSDCWTAHAFIFLKDAVATKSRSY